jgi:hypothetical protein
METAIEPRHPSRLEKKRNIATAYGRAQNVR